MLKIYSLLVNLAFMVIIAGFNQAFVGSLPDLFNNFNLSLVILIFILAFIGLERALYWSVGLGLLADLFSFDAFGANSVCFLLTLLAINFLLNNFFTNRSLYSLLALALFATFLFNAFLMSIGYFFALTAKSGMVSVADPIFWQSLLFELIMNLAFTFISFYIAHYSSNRLKPFFLIKKKI